MKGFPTQTLKLYWKREYTHSHNILPPFPCHVLMTDNNFDQHFYGVKQNYQLATYSLLTNTVFLF